MEVAICIDIGGTNTKLALVNHSYELLSQDSMPTAGYQRSEDYFNSISRRISKMILGLKEPFSIQGIGIGSPSLNLQKQTIQGSANISFLNEVCISRVFKDKFDVPVFLINDGNAAALGEGLKGAAINLRNYILITLGTGLGCGVVVDGEIVQGLRGMAGEFGHVRVQGSGRRCGCGAIDCLETYVSASGIKRTAFEMMVKTNQPTILRSISYEGLSAKLIYELAVGGDPVARKVFEYTGEVLSTKISELITIFDPEAIILAGGLTAAGDILLQPILNNLSPKSSPIYHSKINISISSLAINEAALLGAASLVFKQKK